MEALYFLKLWRPNTNTTTHNKNHQPRSSCGCNSDTTEVSSSVVDTTTDDDYDFDEEDDSFFELELTVSNFNDKCNKCETKTTDSNVFDSNNLKFRPPTCYKDHHQQQPVKPVSRLGFFMFKKSKSMSDHDQTEVLGTPKPSKFFTANFFIRDNIVRKQTSDDSSKRFYKEMIRKYLKSIKPLYVKVSKKRSENPRPSDEILTAASVSSSPATLSSWSPRKEKQGTVHAGIRVVSKHLVKSKSASAATAAPPLSVGRRDDSLILQHDGIQSAILHCKKSFSSSSSRDSSLLSRFANDSVGEKPVASPKGSHEDVELKLES